MPVIHIGATMMIRSTAFAVFMGAVVAVVAFYTIPQSALRDLLAAWQGTTQTAMLEMDRPICSTMDLVADSEHWANLDPDFADGKKALAAGDWNAAIVALKLAALRRARTQPGLSDRKRWGRSACRALLACLHLPGRRARSRRKFTPTWQRFSPVPTRERRSRPEAL
jgi:hypothetical protein